MSPSKIQSHSTGDIEQTGSRGRKNQREEHQGDLSEGETRRTTWAQFLEKLPKDTLEADIVIRQSNGGFSAFDFKTGLQAEGGSRGKALATLAASLISKEKTGSEANKIESPLIELAGIISEEEAEAAKTAIEHSRQADIKKSKEIFTHSEGEVDDDSG